MKRSVISVLLIFLSLSIHGQSNFYKIAAGAGFGVTQSFTEVEKHSFGIAGYGSLDYLFTPFFSIGLELQKGEVNGGEFKQDPKNREFVNSFQAISLNTRLSLGQILDDRHHNTSNLIKGIYLGGGLGMIKSDVVHTTALDPIDYNYAVVDQATSRELLLPVNLGINVNLPDRQGYYRYVVNINLQGNFTFGEGLDGYDDSAITFTSGKPDIFTFISIGVKYNFGPMGLSTKTFRKY